MVLILDGISELVEHARRKIGLFLERKDPICELSRSNKVPKKEKINERDCSLHAHLFISELPSNISTMVYSYYWERA